MITHHPEGFPTSDGRIFPPMLTNSQPHHVYSITYEGDRVLARTTDLYEIELQVEPTCRAMGLRCSVHTLGNAVMWLESDEARALAEKVRC